MDTSVFPAVNPYFCKEYFDLMFEAIRNALNNNGSRQLSWLKVISINKHGIKLWWNDNLWEIMKKQRKSQNESV